MSSWLPALAATARAGLFPDIRTILQAQLPDGRTRAAFIFRHVEADITGGRGGKIAGIVGPEWTAGKYRSPGLIGAVPDFKLKSQNPVSQFGSFHRGEPARPVHIEFSPGECVMLAGTPSGFGDRRLSYIYIISWAEIAGGRRGRAGQHGGRSGQRGQPASG